MNEHILDFLFKIVATRSLVIFFFVFSWYVSNHFCNLSFPWRLNSRRKCIIAGFMTEEIGENMFPLLRWDASGAQHQLVGVTKPLAFLIQSPCFHWTTASDFKQPLSCHIQSSTAKLAAHDFIFWLAITPLQMTLLEKVWGVLKNLGNSLSDGHRDFPIWSKGSWENGV